MKNIPQDIINNRLGFIDSYIVAQNAASGSEVDSNANVTHKTLATLEAELYKPLTIELNRAKVCAKLTERFGKDVAEEYRKDLKAPLTYSPDKSAPKPTCASTSPFPSLLEGQKGGLYYTPPTHRDQA